MPVTFRKLKSGDTGQYRRIRLECLKNFPDNFGSRYEDEVKKPKLPFENYIEAESADNFFFGAFAGDEMVGLAGFIRGSRAKTRHHGDIVSMYVRPDFHGQKVGENLLLALIEDVFALEGIESIELSVVADNAAAARLYEKLGFETFGLQKNYFKSGDRYWDQKFMQLTRERYFSKDYRISG